MELRGESYHFEILSGTQCYKKTSKANSDFVFEEELNILVPLLGVRLFPFAII